jgi:hypothetical protein
MEFKDILENIPVKTEEQLLCKKFTLEDCERIHKSLTLDNPLTYIVFMDRRPDLSEEDKNILFEIIKKLKENEQIEYKFHMDKMLEIN